MNTTCIAPKIYGAYYSYGAGRQYVQLYANTVCSRRNKVERPRCPIWGGLSSSYYWAGYTTSECVMRTSINFGSHVQVATQ